MDSVYGADPGEINVDYNPSENMLTPSDTVQEAYKRDNKYRMFKERRYGRFQRSFSVPSQPNVEEDKIKVKAKHVVIVVTL